jgi:hypothetical protein
VPDVAHLTWACCTKAEESSLPFAVHPHILSACNVVLSPLTQKNPWICANAKQARKGSDSNSYPLYPSTWTPSCSGQCSSTWRNRSVCSPHSPESWWLPPCLSWTYPLEVAVDTFPTLHALGRADVGSVLDIRQSSFPMVAASVTETDQSLQCCEFESRKYHIAFVHLRKDHLGSDFQERILHVRPMRLGDKSDFQRRV